MSIMWDDREDSPDDVRENLAGVEEAESERSAELASTEGEFDNTPEEPDEPSPNASPTWDVGGRPLWE